MELGYHPGFLPAGEARCLFECLLRGVRWHHESLHLHGRTVRVPRLLAWCGDSGVNYRYSGRNHACDGWLVALLPLRQRLADELGMDCNLALINRYRNGSDYMGWHSDDERGHGALVVSLSLGAARRFLVRLPGDARSRRYDLEPGSLLVMDGRARHSLPRTARPVGERINVTFRRIGTP